MRKINLSNEKKRDAEVGFILEREKSKVLWRSDSGTTAVSIRFLISAQETSPAMLEAKHQDLGMALIEGDPEVDFELAGKRLTTLKKVFLRPDGKVAYAVRFFERVLAPDGTEKSTRPVADTPANISVADMPLRWTGKTFPKAKALRTFVFARTYQLQHVNGLTYDFLFDMAKKLSETNSMMLIGAGPKGVAPLVMNANGTPYRAFLEGRVEGDKYALLLHITNLELKEIPDVQ